MIEVNKTNFLFVDQEFCDERGGDCKKFSQIARALLNSEGGTITVAVGINPKDLFGFFVSLGETMRKALVIENAVKNPEFKKIVEDFLSTIKDAFNEEEDGDPE